MSGNHGHVGRVEGQALWDWLGSHPEPSWIEIGAMLGVAPIAVSREAMKQAPDPTAAMQEDLLRGLRRFFPQGWDPSDRTAFLGLVASMESADQTTGDGVRELAQRLGRLPASWIPRDRDDPEIVRVVEGLNSRQS
jgi:hypothetical protein